MLFRTCLTSALLLVSAAAHALPVNAAWTRVIKPAAGSSSIAKAVLDRDGNLVLVGAIGSQFNQSNVLVAKYNPSGTLMWQRQIDGPGNGWDGATDVVIDRFNNIHVGGYLSTGPNTTRDFVRAISPTGAYQTLYIAPDNLGVQRMQAESGGTVFVQRGNLRVDRISNGKSIWHRLYSETLLFMRLDLEDNLWTVNYAHANKLRVTRMKRDGEDRWTMIFNGPSLSVGVNFGDAALTPFDTMVMGGELTSSGVSSPFLVEINNDGGIIWKSYPNERRMVKHVRIVPASNTLFAFFEAAGATTGIVRRYNSSRILGPQRALNGATAIHADEQLRVLAEGAAVPGEATADFVFLDANLVPRSRISQEAMEQRRTVFDKGYALVASKFGTSEDVVTFRQDQLPQAVSIVPNRPTGIRGLPTTFTLNLDAPAPTGGLRTRFSFNFENWVNVTVPAGATKATVARTVPATTSNAPLPVRWEANGFGKRLDYAHRPMRVLSVTLGATSVVAGNPVTVTVRTEGPAPEGSYVWLESTLKGQYTGVGLLKAGQTLHAMTFRPEGVTAPQAGRITADMNGHKVSSPILTVQPAQVVSVTLTRTAVTNANPLSAIRILMDGYAGFPTQVSITKSSPNVGVVPTWTLNSFSKETLIDVTAISTSAATYTLTVKVLGKTYTLKLSSKP